jgi:hypothetical protein
MNEGRTSRGAARKRSSEEPPRDTEVPNKRAKKSDGGVGPKRPSPARTRSKSTTASKKSTLSDDSQQAHKTKAAAAVAAAGGRVGASTTGARDPDPGPLRPRDPNRSHPTSEAPKGAGPAQGKAPIQLRNDTDRDEGDDEDDDDDEDQLAWVLSVSREAQPLREGRHAEEAPRPPSKSYDDIYKEVRVLVEEKLLHKNYSVKVRALGTLAGYFKNDQGGGGEDSAETLLYRRAAIAWDACHMVLLVLRQELARFGGPSRDVAFGTIQFLVHWNSSCGRHRESMSRLDGIGALVCAMRAFASDAPIQDAAIDCLLRFTSDSNRQLRLEVVRKGAALHIGRAMAAHPADASMHERAVLVLGRLSDFAEYRNFGALWGSATRAALKKVLKAHRGATDSRGKLLCRTAGELVQQMVESATV